MATEFWTNADGLTVSFGPIDVLKNIPGVVNTEAFGDTMVAEIDAATVTTSLPANYESGAYIPAGALVESVEVVVDEAFDSAGDLATLSVGTYDEDGVVVDADGLVAAEAEASFTAGAVVAGAGAQVGTVVSENLYVGLIYGTEAFTAGSARLVIKYSK